MGDEVIQELWRIKDELAREANYDVHVLCQQLREHQTTLHGQVVDRSAGAAAVDVQAERPTL
jgi:hypothetical protein